MVELNAPSIPCRYPSNHASGFLTEVTDVFEVQGTTLTLRAHFLRHHGTTIRTAGFAQHLSKLLLDFATPRSQLAAAASAYNATGSGEEFMRLQSEARALFANRVSGEGGELILFYLTECLLQIPQLLCKMRLKTSSEMHVHGVDGIHGRFTQGGRLQLWWGESKMKADVNSAITDCLDGLARYLPDQGGASSPLNRDLQLLSDHLDLNDEGTQKVILALLDQSSPDFPSTEFCGVGLAAFDHSPYPNLEVKEQRDETQNALSLALKTWEKKAKAVVQKKGLTGVTLELFFLPMNSVETFRKEFLTALTLPVSPPLREGPREKKTPKTRAKRSVAKPKAAPPRSKKKGASAE